MSAPIDPIYDASLKVGVGLITEVFKSCLAGLSDADQWIRSANGKYDPFGMAARRYAEKMEECYNSVRIFAMSRPVPLRSIYTRINILKKITSSHRVSVEELERLFDRDRKRFGRLEETEDGICVVNRCENLIVLGKPGAGKTTFLKHIVLQALDRNLSVDRVPIFVGLKHWSDSGRSLMEFITDQFDICGFPKAQTFIERILEGGKCIVLLDGFDEVGERVEGVIAEIRNFTNKHSKNQFVLSCRIAAYNGYFDKFTDVEIADFSDPQIEVFINRWFSDDPVKGRLCWAKMQGDGSIKELASTPLLLTLLCLAFSELMEFPKNRAELYKEALDALLKKWDKSRTIVRDEVYRGLSLRRKESMLCRIAVATFGTGRYFIPQQELEGYIMDYMRDLPSLDSDTLDADAEAILDAITAQHGSTHSLI